MSLKSAVLIASGAAILCTGGAFAAVIRTNTSWADAPSVADVAAAYPAKAKAAAVGGQVTLSCEIGRDGHPKDCAALTEKPSGFGFGAAARKLAERLKVDDASLTGQNIFIPMAFDPTVLSGAATVSNPVWAALPTAEDFQATFPKTQNGVNHVRVVLGCTVQAAGVLGGCAVAQEDPPGQGYGEGALALASKFKLAPWSTEGEPTIGAHIRLPIRYELTPAKQP